MESQRARHLPRRQLPLQARPCAHLDGPDTKEDGDCGHQAAIRAVLGVQAKVALGDDKFAQSRVV